MNFKNYILAILLICTTGNAPAMPSVTIRFNPHTPYYPITYTPTYYPNYSYAYWPTYTYSDYYWFDDYDYYESPAKTFIKTCAIMGVLALALSLIGAIASH